MHRFALWLTALLCMLAVAGCGGGEEEALSEPTIPRGLVEDLAARSEAIAQDYEDGDVCGAARQADELHAAVEEAIEAGEVPAVFQRSLRSTAMQLESEIKCPPPEDKDRGKDDDKAKGKDGEGEGEGEGAGEGNGNGGETTTEGEGDGDTGETTTDSTTVATTTGSE